MSINLSDLAGSTSHPTNPIPVSIGDMGVPTEEPKKNTMEDTDNFIGQAMADLDNKINELNAANEEKQAAAEEAALDEDINEGLENFDPDAIAPTHVDAIRADASAKMETASGVTSELQTKMDENEAEVEAVDEKAVEKKRDEEFNDIFKNDDNLSSDDRDLLDALADADDDTTPSDDTEEEEVVRSKEEEEENLRQYKEQIRVATKPAVSFDTSGFTVSTKHISMNKLLAIKEPETKIADWIQPTAKRSFSMSEFSGIDIQKLNVNTQGRNRINTVKDVYRTLYNHLVGATQDGFEAWLRSTPYRDYAQFYFAAYKATFGDANFITYQCLDPKCSHYFIQEQPIDSMYEVDDDFKDEFKRILNQDTTLAHESETEILPVSNYFAIGLTEPTIYSVEIERLMIDDETAKKYSRIVGFLPFIDKIYYINQETKQFVPVDERPVPQNFAKTIKHKLAIYYNILNSLSNDQMSLIQAHVVNYNARPIPIKFFNPECTCPKCGKVIEKQAVDATDLLFNRAQSALVANLSEN